MPVPLLRQEDAPVTDIAPFTAIILAVLGGLRWLWTLSGRIDAVRDTAKASHDMAMAAIGAHERTCDERMRRLDERNAHILTALQDINEAVRGLGSRRAT